jgi:hypothetical protein
MKAYKPNISPMGTIPYPQGFRILDFLRFNDDDARTTHEHIGHFLAQANDVGITDVHRVRLFPLSLSGTAFHWFTSLAPNTIDTWPALEQKFHDYFYNGEVELKLSDLTFVRQKYTETVPEYLRQFRETRNICYNLTIGEKDLVDLAFVGLSPYLREKMEGQEFIGVNQVLQRALSRENRAKDGRSYRRFKDSSSQDKEKHSMSYVDGEAKSEGDNEICVAECVETFKDKPISCLFLKPNGEGGGGEKMK